MFAGTALSVRLFVYAGLSLFIIYGPYLYVVVCVLYAYNLTLVEKDLLADDDDGGEASVPIDLDPDVTDLMNPFKSVLPMWSHDAKSIVLQEQNLRMIQPTQQLLHAAQEIVPSQQSTSAPVKKQS